MATTITVQQLVSVARAYPDLVPVLGQGGYSQEPALTIANDVMQEFLAQNFNWKFNRGLVAPFLTVALQQDYVTNVTDLGWLEQGWRIDINNTLAGDGTGAPKPIFAMETVRDLEQTSTQAHPFNLSFIPNTLAIMGQWRAHTNYPSGYQQAQTPVTPIQQFIDANGNILFLDSAALKLNIQSQGFAGGGGTSQPGFGLSGNVQPFAAPNAAPGTLVTDNQLVWTVADPNGYAIRLAPLPAMSGLCWLIQVVYQKKPPILTSLQQKITPIPDEHGYLFRAGFFAKCREHAKPGTREALEGVQMWKENLVTALRAADRERENASFYPSESLMGGGPNKYGMPVGPAWPFSYWE